MCKKTLEKNLFWWPVKFVYSAYKTVTIPHFNAFGIDRKLRIIKKCGHHRGDRYILLYTCGFEQNVLSWALWTLKFISKVWLNACVVSSWYCCISCDNWLQKGDQMNIVNTPIRTQITCILYPKHYIYMICNNTGS